MERRDKVSVTSGDTKAARSKGPSGQMGAVAIISSIHPDYLWLEFNAPQGGRLLRSVAQSRLELSLHAGARTKLSSIAPDRVKVLFEARQGNLLLRSSSDCSNPVCIQCLSAAPGVSSNTGESHNYSLAESVTALPPRARSFPPTHCTRNVPLGETTALHKTPSNSTA